MGLPPIVAENGELIMTNREFYALVSAGTINDEVMAHASAAIEKMDAANEKRKNTPSKTAEANAPLVEAIITGILTQEPMTGLDIAEKLNAMFPDLEKPVTVNKVASLLKGAVAAGEVVKSDIKVEKATRKAYALA